MRLNLLISLKNGRALKTYGVKTVPFNNMKFTFIICVVIAFSYSECAWAQRDILTDLNYLNDLSQIDRSPIFKSFKRPEEYEGLYKRWPWRHSPDEDIDGIERTENEYEPDTNSENLVKIQEVVDMASAQLANRRHPSYEKLLTRLQDRFKHLKDTTDKVNLLSQYLFSNSPNTDRLEEVRMYPEDFTFNEEEGNKVYRDANDFDIDDEEETVDNDPSPSGPLYPQLKPVMRFKPEHHKPMHGMHHGHEEYTFQDGEEFPVISFKDVPVADDPSEFGFGPSDPRFDGTPTKEALQTFKAPEPLHQQSLYQTNPTNNVKLTLRSDPQKITNLPPNEDIFSFSNKAKFSGSDIDVVAVKPETSQGDNAGVYIIAVVAGISAAATVGLIAVGIGWYNLQKHMKNAEDTDYPSYGIVGPNKDYEKKERDDAGDRRLAQSAQMYHYQHQKQQIIAMGRNPQGHGSLSDTEEEEDDEGNYTVYECPGLASIEGPLEVKNPMFDDDQLATPSQTPSKPTNAEDPK